MVVLGKGRKRGGGKEGGREGGTGGEGLADLKIEERLHRYIVGGKEGRKEGGREGREEEEDESGLLFGRGKGGREGGREGARKDVGGNKENGEYRCGHGFDSSKCSRIYEGAYINTDVTAPGATLALGMMFLKSNNAGVAAVSVSNAYILRMIITSIFQYVL